MMHDVMVSQKHV